MTTDSDRMRKTKRLIEAIEALRLALKQFDVHAGELETTLNEEIKSVDAHDTGTLAERK